MCTFFIENWQEIVISFLGAFFGFGLALIIEYWKIKSDKKKEKNRIKEEMNKKVDYYNNLLKDARKKTNQQIKLIQQNNEIQSKNYLNPIPLQHISTNSFTRLKTIDNRGVFEALADRFKDDEEWMNRYNRLNSCLDFIEGVICGELDRINKVTLKKGFNDLLYVKSLIDDIPNILTEEAIKKRHLFGDNRFNNNEYVFLNDAISVYHTLVIKKADIDRINNEFLEPLLLNIKPFELEDYAKKVIFNCKNARVRMNDIRNDIKNTTSNYQKIINDMKEPIVEIDKMIQLLSK